MLSVVLSHLSKSQYAKKIIFKGGTAIKKAHFPDARFSVDLDFNFFDVSGDVLANEVKALFDGRTILEAHFLEVRREDISDDKALLRLEYKAQLDHADNVRLDFVSKEPVLTTPYRWTPKDDYDVARRVDCEHLVTRHVDLGGYIDLFYACNLGRMPRGNIDDRRACIDCRMKAPRRGDISPSAFRAMSPEEILSEKIRACLVRARARDLYDIYFLQSKQVKLDRGMTVDKLRFYQEFKETIPSLMDIADRLREIEPEWDRDLRVLVPSESYPTFQEALANTMDGLRKCGWKESRAT